MRRTSWALMLMLASLAAACDQVGPASPDINATISGGDGIVGTGATPSAEEVDLCKVSNAPGLFNFTLTATSADAVPVLSNDGADGSATTVPGQCERVAFQGGLQDFVTITESVPAGFVLDSIVVQQLLGNGSIVTTTLCAAIVASCDAIWSAPNTAGALITGGAGTGEGAVVTFYNRLVPAAGAVLLIIDEDGIDNGLHVNKYGGFITPAGPQFFTPYDVNENKASLTQRGVLPYFAANIGRTITVVTGRTNDEGWFAPNCIPAKMLPALFDKENNTCLTNGNRDLAIDNFFGLNGPGAIPLEERLDKIPHLIPLRSLGIVSLIGKDVCALVRDSDIPTNYDHDKPEGVNGSFKGNMLGIVAFHVNSVAQLNGFSSSTLPQVNITILNTNICGTWQLFRAPVPKTSSIPNDRLVPPSTVGYKSFTLPPVFF